MATLQHMLHAGASLKGFAKKGAAHKLGGDLATHWSRGHKAGASNAHSGEITSNAHSGENSVMQLPRVEQSTGQPQPQQQPTPPREAAQAPAPDREMDASRHGTAEWLHKPSQPITGKSGVHSEGVIKHPATGEIIFKGQPANDANDAEIAQWFNGQLGRSVSDAESILFKRTLALMGQPASNASDAEIAEWFRGQPLNAEPTNEAATIPGICVSLSHCV